MFQDGYCLLMLVGSYIPSIKLRDLRWFFATASKIARHWDARGCPQVDSCPPELWNIDLIERIAYINIMYGLQINYLNSPHFLGVLFLIRDPNSWWVFLKENLMKKLKKLEVPAACSAPDSRPIALHGQHTDGFRWRSPGGWSSDMLHVPIFRLFFIKTGGKLPSKTKNTLITKLWRVLGDDFYMEDCRRQIHGYHQTRGKSGIQKGHVAVCQNLVPL